jgi:hypothetical protein
MILIQNALRTYPNNRIIYRNFDLDLVDNFSIIIMHPDSAL